MAQAGEVKKQKQSQVGVCKVMVVRVKALITGGRSDDKQGTLAFQPGPNKADMNVAGRLLV